MDNILNVIQKPNSYQSTLISYECTSLQICSWNSFCSKYQGHNSFKENEKDTHKDIKRQSWKTDKIINNTGVNWKQSWFSVILIRVCHFLEPKKVWHSIAIAKFLASLHRFNRVQKPLSHWDHNQCWQIKEAYWVNCNGSHHVPHLISVENKRWELARYWTVTCTCVSFLSQAVWNLCQSRVDERCQKVDENYSLVLTRHLKHVLLFFRNVGPSMYLLLKWIIKASSLTIIMVHFLYVPMLNLDNVIMLGWTPKPQILTNNNNNNNNNNQVHL